MSNHDQTFSTVRPGISITNPFLDELGTLGLLLPDPDGGPPWILSCAHVLFDDTGPPDGPPQEIVQPAGGRVVATCARENIRPSFDVAMAQLKGAVTSDLRVLGFGPIAAPADPVVDMHVLKSGIGTGVTEGIVTRVDPYVEVRPESSMPPTYELTRRGDSGAVWLDLETRSPVAVHQRGNSSGREYSQGLSLLTALEILGFGA